MTHRELLRAPRDALSPALRQRQHLLKVELTAVPCPACREPTDALIASDTDVDDYRFGVDAPAYACPCCHAPLERIVPLSVGPSWHWQLDNDWLAERLRKAELYDRLSCEEGRR